MSSAVQHLKHLLIEASRLNAHSCYPVLKSQAVKLWIFWFPPMCLNMESAVTATLDAQAPSRFWRYSKAGIDPRGNAGIMNRPRRLAVVAAGLNPDFGVLGHAHDAQDQKEDEDIPELLGASNMRCKLQQDALPSTIPTQAV